MKNYLKLTTLKSIRKGHLFCFNVTKPNGTKVATIYERGKWAGHVQMWSDEKHCFEARTDYYEALNAITHTKEILISSSCEVWKI